MMTFGLIGHNISYSKSPRIHAYMAHQINIPFRYELLDIEKNQLRETIQLLKRGQYQGFNVTIPYKTDVLAYVDQLTDHAKRIGAVNTIYLKDGKIMGDNTDYAGFKGLLAFNNIHVKKKEVYVLGTGGAAKAVYAVLTDLGAYVTVVSRNPQLSKRFSRVIGYQSIDPKAFDIIVNATPVGTYPHLNDSPIDVQLVKHKTVIDLIYRPEHTMLVQHAKRGVGGLDMLIIQAIHSEMDWFEKKIHIKHHLIKEIKEVVLHE